MTNRATTFNVLGAGVCSSLVLLLLLAPQLVAYKPPMDIAGPLTVSIEGPLVVTRSDTSIRYKVIIENQSQTVVRGVVRIKVIDRWRLQDPSSLQFVAKGRGGARLSFDVIAGKGTYNAHYPIHAFAEFEYHGKRLTAHPILVLETKLENAPRGGWHPEWKPIPVPINDALGLWLL